MINLDEPRWGMYQLSRNGLTMVDLFCGAGIGACGFKLAGYEILKAYDNQPYAVETYNKNIGNHAEVIDIRKLKSEDIPSADYMVAGFPCQPFSVSGKGEGVEDVKSGDLGYHFYRIVRDKQPKAFLFENVGGLLTKKHISFFYELVKLFEEAGYEISYPKKENGDVTTLNCWEHGVPQLRKRVFVVGIRKDLGKKFMFPEPIQEKERTNIRYAIGDLPDPDGKRNHSGYGIRKDEAPYVDKIPPGGNWRNLAIDDQRAFLGGAYNSGGGRTGFLRKIDFDKPCHTLTSCMNGKNNAQILDNADKYKEIGNHELYYEGGYSPRFASRNRQKQWEEPSFTIVSTARQLPLFPEPANYDIRKTNTGEIPPPRRFTVRECLRLQTVPDWFEFGTEIKLEKQYERCSGIPSLIAYTLGIEIANIIKQ